MVDERKTCGDFNPRSREGSDVLTVSKMLLTSHFNPRSREGSDCDYYMPFYLPGISIRAPARGATGNLRYTVLSCHISIRAPARGATKRENIKVPRKKFQSALPRGERQ